MEQEFPFRLGSVQLERSTHTYKCLGDCGVQDRPRVRLGEARCPWPDLSTEVICRVLLRAGRIQACEGLLLVRGI